MFMSKVAVVYWSGTGNTEAMAVFVAEGAKGKGADVALLTSSEFDVSMMDNYDAVAFGCPSMGSFFGKPSDSTAKLAKIIIHTSLDDKIFSPVRTI